ncbi:MAG: Ger(x)C family germination protein [Bacillales bacterium]|jgi:spore germination protein KC|nr:Ger(x)C family germination protein [Bacillales bacterium]
MIKKIIVVCLIVLLSNFSSGCYNRRELNELAIVLGMAIDYVDGKYTVSVQVADPSSASTKTGATGASPVIIYRTEAESIFEAVRKMTTVAPRKMYFAHVRIIVLNENLAKKGIGESLELITRDPEFRSDFHVIIAKGIKAREVLMVLTPLENYSAQKLFDSLGVSEKFWAPTNAVEFDALISEMLTYGKSPVITGIIKKGDIDKGSSMKNIEKTYPSTKLKFFGLGVIRGDKLVGWLDEVESKGYNYIIGEVDSTVGPIKCPDQKGNVVVEVTNAKSKIIAKFVNGKPKIKLEISYEANVGEVLCKNLRLTNPKHIEILEKNAEKRNKEILETSVKRAKELGTDIFGFGTALYRENPKEWHKIEKDWNKKGFKEVEVKISSEANIRRTGTTSESYLKDIKE